MKRIFVGGKGFGLWRLWHTVTGETKWDDPENEIVIGAGPIAGTALYPGTGKSLVVTISPLTHIVWTATWAATSAPSEVCRFGCARDPGQGRQGRHHLDRRRHRPRDHRRGSAGSG